MNRFALLAFALAIAMTLPLAACSRSSAAASGGAADAEAAPGVTVATQPVTAKPTPRYLPLTGQLKSGRDADLAANASGRVTLTRVERGSEVKAGDVLATVDVRAATLSAAEAKAMAETAASSASSSQTECERTRALVASGAVGKAELDRMEAQCQRTSLAVNAAQARAQLAAQNVGDGVIRAPFAGVVTERYVDVGEFVRHDSRVVTLVDLSALRLELTVPETNIASARAGAKLLFSVAGYPGKVFSGTLKFVGASVRPTTRDIVAEATLDDADGSLRPGMFASVRLAVGEDRLPVVPKTAIAIRGGKPSAFVAVDGRLEQRIVQPGDVLGDEVVVLRGLAEGDRLVVPATDALQNGLRVGGK